MSHTWVIQIGPDVIVDEEEAIGVGMGKRHAALWGIGRRAVACWWEGAEASAGRQAMDR